jgi:hypothetical protein
MQKSGKGVPRDYRLKVTLVVTIGAAKKFGDWDG